MMPIVRIRTIPVDPELPQMAQWQPWLCDAMHTHFVRFVVPVGRVMCDHHGQEVVFAFVLIRSAAARMTHNHIDLVHAP